MQQERSRWRHVRARCDEQPGQPLGGPESSQRVGITAAHELKRPASLVEHHASRWLGLSLKRTLGLVQPRLCLLQPHLPDPRGTKGRVGGGDDRLLGPAVFPGQLDRLHAPLHRQRT